MRLAECKVWRSLTEWMQEMEMEVTEKSVKEDEKEVKANGHEQELHDNDRVCLFHHCLNKCEFSPEDSFRHTSKRFDNEHDETSRKWST